MKQLVNYALVRFMPFDETGEFANVGVLLCAPETGYWQFKLAPAKFARVTDFFKEMDKQVYTAAIKNFKAELELIMLQAKAYSAKELFDYFKETTRERQALLRFSNPRALLCEKPDIELNALFQRYIHRDFATKQYREHMMDQALRKQIGALNNAARFTDRKIQAGIREFKVPFATEGTNNLRIIKPLAFEHQTANDLYEHGEKWLNRLNAVVKEGIAVADDVLLPIDTIQLRGDKKQAYDLIRNELKGKGFQVVNFAETDRVIQFAKDLN